MGDRSELLGHYGAGSFLGRLKAALAAAGLGDNPLEPSSLAPLDQFHARGLAATVELAEAIGIQPGESIIDIGSGLGGPSRYLAANYDCRVIGVDLSPWFVEAASFLAERCGLDDRVGYRCGDALALPFEDARFDIAWTQHVAMNIADRDGFYAEAFRVLRPGGRFAIYDVVAREGQDVLFPVPWSRTPGTSFLLTAAEMRTMLARLGFQSHAWTDSSDAALRWFAEQRIHRASSTPPALGLHLAMGPEFPVMVANFERNLSEGRIGLVQAILARPGRGPG